MPSRTMPLLWRTAPERLRFLKSKIRTGFPTLTKKQLYKQGAYPVSRMHVILQATECCQRHNRYWIDDSCGFRRLGWADEHINLRHTGWYADTFQDETFRGVVFQVSARNGMSRYIAGYGESFSDGYVLDLTHVWHDDLTGASRAADQMAEDAAEVARLHCAQFQAEQRGAAIADELVQIRQDILDLCRSMRALCPDLNAKHPTVRQPVERVLKQSLQDLLGQRHSLRRERDLVLQDPWQATQYSH